MTKSTPETGIGQPVIRKEDAALLIELPPGAYTAQLGSGDATGGSALLEIYVLP